MAGHYTDKDNRGPAMLASLTLHVLLFGSAFIALPFLSTPVKEVNSVPITIVTQAPPQLSQTEEAPKAEQAAAPDVAPTIVQPAASPPPTPTPPTPKPTPAPTPPKLAPTPKPIDLSALASSLPQAKPSKAPPPKSQAKSVDLGALAASLPKRPTGAVKGAVRPAVDLSKIAGPSKPLSGDDLSALQAKLIRLWTPNCTDEAGSRVVVRVELKLNPDGRLASPPQVLDRAVLDAEGPVVAASAQRALVAAQRGEPYTELPRDRYELWKDIIVRFNAKQACAGA